jgi:hypothetical protein
LTGRAAPLPEFGIFCCETGVFDITRDAVSAKIGPLSTTVDPKIREERQIAGQPSPPPCLQPVYPAWEKPND